MISIQKDIYAFGTILYSFDRYPTYYIYKYLFIKHT